jgi:uncharacterized spore protein YtfJ
VKEVDMGAKETMERLRDALSAKTVYGEPYEKNGLTVITAASVRGGGGGGEADDAQGTGHGSGSGFGLMATPVGAYVVQDGSVTWKPAVDRNRTITLGAVVLLALLWTYSRIARARSGSS